MPRPSDEGKPARARHRKVFRSSRPCYAPTVILFSPIQALRRFFDLMMSCEGRGQIDLKTQSRSPDAQTNGGRLRPRALEGAAFRQIGRTFGSRRDLLRLALTREEATHPPGWRNISDEPRRNDSEKSQPVWPRGALTASRRGRACSHPPGYRAGVTFRDDGVST